MANTANMPMIPFGEYSISRLIVGSNTLNAGSHLSRFTNRQMKEYFTTERVLAHLEDCCRAGINTWQSISSNLSWHKMLKERGIGLNFISLGWETDEEPQMLENIKDAGGIAVAHHGEFTDSYFKEGSFRRVREYCRRIRDTGMMVGISTHMPVVLQRILDEDWDVDFFMCCVYERHRTRAELKELLGYVPIPLREVYLEEDPARMFAVIQQTDKPCLAFKILAAGRLCETQEMVEEAFRKTFAQLKPNDAVIVGMYPEYEDQVALNAKYVRRYSSLSGFSS